MLLLCLCFFLAGCVNDVPDANLNYVVGEVHGVRSHYVRDALMRRVLPSAGAKQLNVQYTIFDAPLLVRADRNSLFEAISVAILVSVDGVQRKVVVQYQYLGYEKWKYDDKLFEFIAENAIATAKTISFKRK